tara:strand:+ start:84 stop:1592 length:1509 start_codon:yes stop_codon:yes gene_type:complete
MPKTVIAGFDAGTSKFRCLLFDLNGNEKFSTSLKTPLKKNQDGLFYNSSEDIFDISIKIIRKVSLFAKKNNLTIKSIAFSSVAEAGIPIDKKGHALLGAIPWYDHRTQIIKNNLSKKLDEKFIYKNTGLSNDHFYSAYKILWIKKYKPVIYKKIYKWLPICDFLAWKFTGEISTDFSQAMRTMLFDPQKMNWSEKMIKKTKINKNILPKLVNTGDKKGLIKENLKKILSLKNDCVVGAGGHDDFVATFAMGGFKKNIAVNSLGSAEAVIVNTNKFERKAILNKSKFISGVFKTKETKSYYIVGSILTSSLVTDWYKNLLDIKNYSNFISILKNSEGVKKNIFVFPQFEFSHSPINEKNSKGVIWGINTNTNKGDIYKSILECLSFDTKNALEFILKKTKIRINKLLCSGGGIRNKEWLKIRSNILNKKLYINTNHEKVSLGSAILGGLAANIYENEKKAFSKIKHKEIIIKNDAHQNKIYKEIFSKKYLPSIKFLIQLNKMT